MFAGKRSPAGTARARRPVLRPARPMVSRSFGTKPKPASRAAKATLAKAARATPGTPAPDAKPETRSEPRPEARARHERRCGAIRDQLRTVGGPLAHRCPLSTKMKRSSSQHGRVWSVPAGQPDQGEVP